MELQARSDYIPDDQSYAIESYAIGNRSRVAQSFDKVRDSFHLGKDRDDSIECAIVNFNDTKPLDTYVPQGKVERKLSNGAAFSAHFQVSRRLTADSLNDIWAYDIYHRINGTKNRSTSGRPAVTSY